MKNKFILSLLACGIFCGGCETSNSNSQQNISNSKDNTSYSSSLPESNSSPIEQTYTITWVNYDDTVLEIDYEVPKGSTPTFDGITPSRDSDNQYSYEFIGWTPTVSKAFADATYKAQFKRITNTYTIVWKNWDGTILETDKDVPYGSMASFDSGIPSRENNEQYSYEFTGWNPNVTNVFADAIYIAQYEKTLRKYDVVWKNWDGTILETDKDVPYGTTPTYNGLNPTKPSENGICFKWAGWSPAITEVTGNVKYIATFENDDSLGLALELSPDRTFYIITGIGTCDLIDLTIPSTYNNKPVTEIASYAFENCNQLISVTIPSSVIFIGEYAFKDCTRLIKFETKGKINDLGSAILSGCFRLEELVLYHMTQKLYLLFQPSSIQYSSLKDSSEIPGDIDGFKKCVYTLTQKTEYGTTYYIYQYVYWPKNLAKITFIANIPSEALRCTGYYTKFPVTDIIIKDSVTSIGNYAFSGMPLENICLPINLITIGNHAFENTKLKNITFPNTVQTIGDYSFSHCDGLSGLVLPNSLKTIGAHAFEYCTHLVDVTFPNNNFQTIGDYAFYYCSALTNVTLGNSVQKIKSYAFYYCQKLYLSEFVLSKSITCLEDYCLAFQNQDFSIKYEGTIEEFNSIQKSSYWNYTGSYSRIKTVKCSDGNINY